MLRLVSVGSAEAGVFAVGQEAKGVIAIGQLATGVIAVGQIATGVIAIGQVARGFIAIGQAAFGIVAVGMISGGVLWCAGAGVAGTSGPGAVFGLLGRVQPRRVLALARREPWDTTPHWPVRRRVAGIVLFPVLVVLWWFVAGQPALATL